MVEKSKGDDDFNSIFTCYTIKYHIRKLIKTKSPKNVGSNKNWIVKKLFIQQCKMVKK